MKRISTIFWLIVLALSIVASGLIVWRTPKASVPPTPVRTFIADRRGRTEIPYAEPVSIGDQLAVDGVIYEVTAVRHIVADGQNQRVLFTEEMCGAEPPCKPTEQK